VQIGSLLRVNVEDTRVWREPPPRSWGVLGGRALVARIALREIPPLCAPLGRHNRFLVLSEPLVQNLPAPGIPLDLKDDLLSFGVLCPVLVDHPVGLAKPQRAVCEGVPVDLAAFQVSCYVLLDRGIVSDRHSSLLNN
jgi:hypothetical protein